jgi:hypothetical protein
MFGAHDPDWPKIRTQANAWRIELNGMTDALRPIAPLVDRACYAVGDESSFCKMARAAWATAQEANALGFEAVNLFDDLGRAEAEAEFAVERAHRAAEVVEAARSRLQEVIDGMAQNADRSRGGGQGVAPPGQDTAAGPPAEGAGASPGDAGPGENADEDRGASQ